MNRANQTQVAKLYANEVAISSYTQGNMSASGAVMIMEIYTPKKMRMASLLQVVTVPLKLIRCQQLL